MPDIGVGLSRQAVRTMRSVAELADGGLAEAMRIDAGVRLLVAARRAAATLPGFAPVSPAAALVTRVTRGWDSSALTAAEYLEGLTLAELDAFLAAGPDWAAEQRDEAQHAAVIRRAA